MSPFKSTFLCLSIWLSLMVYAVLSLFATSIVFKQETVLENETNSDTTSTDGTVLHERTSDEQGPGGGGKQGSDKDNEVHTEFPSGTLHRNKDVIENKEKAPEILRLRGGGRKKPKVHIFDEHTKKDYIEKRLLHFDIGFKCRLSSSRNVPSGPQSLRDDLKRRLERRWQVGMHA